MYRAADKVGDENSDSSGDPSDFSESEREKQYLIEDPLILREFFSEVAKIMVEIEEKPQEVLNQEESGPENVCRCSIL